MTVPDGSKSARGPVAVGGRGRCGGGGAATRHTQSQLRGTVKGKSKPRRSARLARCADEPFVVIVSNVENDFAKVHQAILPGFCGLDVLRQQQQQQQQQQRHVALGQSAISVFAGHTAAHSSVSPHTRARSAEVDTTASQTHLASTVAAPTPSRCTYELRCRTETRSAELCIYGTTGSSVGSVFVPRAQASRRATTDGVYGNTTSHDDAQLQQVCVALQKRPYMHYPLNIQVHSVHDAMCTPNASTLSSQPTAGHVATSAQNADTIPGLTMGPTAHEKVGGQQDKGDKVAAAATTSMPTSSSSQQPLPLPPPLQQQEEMRTQTAATAAAAQDSVAVTKPTRQAELVTAVALVSAHVSARAMRQLMHDVPGFVSCWPLRARQFRVVFLHEAALMRAKQLLDKFELDGGVRVVLRLSDAMQRRHEVAHSF